MAGGQGSASARHNAIALSTQAVTGGPVIARRGVIFLDAQATMHLLEPRTLNHTLYRYGQVLGTALAPCPPSGSGDWLLFVTANGSGYRVDLREPTGPPRPWHLAATGVRIAGQVAVSDGFLIFPGSDRCLHALSSTAAVGSGQAATEGTV